MLKTLRIRNLAVIDDVAIEFDDGLSLLTGETGAGKSILVDALGLAAGARADSTMIRSGADRATVEAVVDLPRGSPVRSLLVDRGVDVEGDGVAIRREVAATGAGRVYVNGCPTTVAVLRAVGDHLMELHGQHDQRSLLQPDRQREVLDEFGGHGPLLDAVGEAWRSVVDGRRRLDELATLAEERERRSGLLRREIEEIDAVSPRPGELDGLLVERRRLQNSSLMSRLLEEAIGMLYEGETTAASLAAAAARNAEQLAQLDPGLEEIARRLHEARVDIEDVGAALRDYRDDARFDAGRLEQLESRRAALETLLLRYGPDEESALGRREEAERELATLAGLEKERETAGDSLSSAEAAYVKSAEALTRARRAAATRMAREVEAQLRDLALPKARVRIELAEARGDVVESGRGKAVALRPTGAERVEFLLAANPGEPPQPIAKVASGGELSRVMLAIHVVSDKTGDRRILVFDEIDAGVSGAVADAVGARLAVLASSHQVLCVTHLPQVAAYADHHYHVRKRVTGKRTRTEVVPLDGKERVDELARMLGGRQATPASRRNAAALLTAAAAGSTAAPRSRQAPGRKA